MLKWMERFDVAWIYEEKYEEWLSEKLHEADAKGGRDRGRLYTRRTMQRDSTLES